MEQFGRSDHPGAAFLERRGPVAIITLNRPELRNVVDAEVSAGVGAAMETLARSPDLRVGIITGAGGTFCAGADVVALTAGHSIDAPGHPEWGFAGFVHHEIDKPLIAAVNGSASGGGLDLVLACNAAIVSSHATLGPRAVRRYEDCNFRSGALGGRLRFESVSFRDTLHPETALRCGIIDRIVHPHEVLPEAMRLARALATTRQTPDGIGAAVLRRRSGKDDPGLQRSCGADAHGPRYSRRGTDTPC
ncbi:enoyl-CoA hydratase-related protein [Rhodococcus sp. USK13]|uniref:enoyl-CoA hydratase-related protein n=1 Tax=Rhodococcus sp. USK13 TaxID=2806442 RepID=UPI001BD1B7FF|nr:enoyl-CoA hydratase-related protein [Rhodococcus sp. USK13]